MKIAMLISGGVDSSVALRRLLQAGHEVHAFYMKIWLEDELQFLGECPWEDDLKYVRAVCEQAGVPLTVVPFQKEYWERVVSYVIDEVKQGRTPNPDMLCNARIKFGAFYEAIGKEYDKIATGHYAQTECLVRDVFPMPGSFGAPLFSGVGTVSDVSSEERRKIRATATLGRSCAPEGIGMENNISGVWYLKCSPDPIKDQTYFLSQLSQEQVVQALFPIGDLKKSEVRKLAKEFNLPNAERKDSQGICFLGKIEFDKFLEYYLGKKEGDIIDWKTGKKLGTHDGFWFYTIGQRRNIGLSGGPWYVVKKDPVANRIFISNHYRSEEMFRNTFEVAALNWVTEKPKNKDLSVKIRHGEKHYACRISFLKNGNVKVKLVDEMDKGIAAGQFAVFYEGEYCLGGGVILEA
jgi:tRNA-specific 2-thiouridylase